MQSELNNLPVVVVGAGPIGLAAAAHLIERRIPVRVYEAGEQVGATIGEWAHVRTFSPWSYNVDSASARILARHGWEAPEPEHIPTGGEILRDYLLPLANTPEMAAVVENGAKVTRISRLGIDKVTSKDRETKPYVLSVLRSNGSVRREFARAVIDASGTWMNQNPLGSEGLPAEGEAEHRQFLAYGMPDVLEKDRSTYAGKTTFVVGAGYSAANVLLDLSRLAQDASGTIITWVVRGTNLIRVYGGSLADELPARGKLGAEVQALVDSGRVTLVSGFRTTALRAPRSGVILEGDTDAGTQQIGPADRIVVATGQRPDLEITRELRLDLDPWLESAKALGPLIDPNLHSCGSVPPHGHRELSHPEPGFYTIGVKSYGRAPTFLLLTGFEQARSVAAAISGDMAAADAVQLVLPETGVCSTRSAEFEVAGSPGCCGGPAPTRADACCQLDARVKDAGGDGCGCSSARVEQPSKVACCGVAA